MKKRILSMLLAVVLVLGLLPMASADWENFRGSSDNMAITAAPVPTDPTTVVEKWVTAESLKSGSGWNISNPAPMLVVNEKIITTSGNKLLEVDRQTGQILRTAEMADVCGTLGNSAPAYGSGLIFMPLQDGRVQAFDPVTFMAVWLSETLGSQCTTGLVYDNGFVFGCTGNAKPGGVFCLEAVDTEPESCQKKVAVWNAYEVGDEKGSYFSTPIVTETAVVYGTDSGYLCSRNRTDGALLSRLQLPDGKQRSGIALYKGRVYGGTSAGYLFSAALAADGTLSDLRAEKDETVSAITSTPVIYNEVVYYGGSKMVMAADADTLKTLRTTGTTGFEQPKFGGAVQASLLLHPAEDGVYLYATQNCKPGGLYLVKDTGTEMTAAVLHTPAEDKQEYCLVSPICHEDGTIYYRNDSGYLFAVGTKEEEPAKITASVSVVDHKGTALYAETEKQLSAGATAYDILLQTDLEIYAVSGEYGMYVQGIGDLKEQTTGGLRYWMYEVNGESPMVGASSYMLQDGDKVCWKYYVEEELPAPPTPPATPTQVTATVRVVNHQGTALYAETQKQLSPGATAYDILLLTGLEIDAVSTDYGMYVRSIAGLTEKSLGSGSGWVYEINGESPEVGASACVLKSGDRVCWKFVAGDTVPVVVMPSVKEEPKQEQEMPMQFTDAVEHWAQEAIGYVVKKKIMKGVSSTEFAPEHTVTRSMVMTVLARMAGTETEGGATWYEKALQWAVEQGISDGSDAEGSITREQLATMLYRYAGSPAVTGAMTGYTDAAQVSEYAANAMLWAVENGIITGMSETTLGAKEETTRAQLAVMLMRFAEVQK